MAPGSLIPGPVQALFTAVLDRSLSQSCPASGASSSSLPATSQRHRPDLTVWRLPDSSPSFPLIWHRRCPPCTLTFLRLPWRLLPKERPSPRSLKPLANQASQSPSGKGVHGRRCSRCRALLGRPPGELKGLFWSHRVFCASITALSTLSQLFTSPRRHCHQTP